MATATNLTPTEVIDRVRAAPHRPTQQPSRSWRWPWSGRGCTPARPTRRRRTGARPTCTTKAWSHWPAGAPWVAEFAPVHLAAALGITQDAGRQLIADALELAHRLPRLWKQVLAGAVPVWRARLIARETTDLSVQAALFADRLIAATPRRIGQVKAAQLVQEARLYFDPDRAIADEEEALTKRGVWLRHGGAPATTDITMTLDTPDALLFDQTVARIAGDLKELGDTEELEVRRARAVGILADPQHALDLLSGRDAAAPSHRAQRRCREPLRAPHPRRPDRCPPQTGRSTGAATIEKLGAATTQLLTDWLTRFAAAGTKITLRPVLDLNSDAAVDQHDPPDAMRETVVLRDAHCVFPGCGRDSRACDLDHITEYLPMEDGGPPGQTRARESRAAVPDPPPREDPHRLALQTPRRRQLSVDGTDRTPVHRHAQLADEPNRLTASLWLRPLDRLRHRSRLSARFARCSTTCGCAPRPQLSRSTASTTA